MAEIKQPLTRFKRPDGDEHYVIEGFHTYSDILRHVVAALGREETIWLVEHLEE
jgi:hypothetical protein